MKGAPDVFTAYAGLTQNKDIDLVLGELLGASMFIGTLVLGSVLLVSNSNKLRLSAADFYRDTTIYIMLIAAVILICMDGHISLAETALLLGIYALYIFVVVLLSRLRLRKRRLQQQQRRHVAFKSARSQSGRETSPLLQPLPSPLSTGINPVEATENDSPSTSEYESASEGGAVGDHDTLDTLMPGVIWPNEAGVLVKLQFILEFPFSFLRGISIPAVVGLPHHKQSRFYLKTVLLVIWF